MHQTDNGVKFKAGLTNNSKFPCDLPLSHEKLFVDEALENAELGFDDE
jgi:hypothetical protein